MEQLYALTDRLRHDELCVRREENVEVLVADLRDWQNMLGRHVQRAIHGLFVVDGFGVGLASQASRYEHIDIVSALQALEQRSEADEVHEGIASEEHSGSALMCHMQSFNYIGLDGRSEIASYATLIHGRAGVDARPHLKPCPTQIFGKVNFDPWQAGDVDGVNL